MGEARVTSTMDEQTREGLNFFLTAVVVLALLALFSALMFPSWLVESALFVAVVVAAAFGVARVLTERGIVAEWGLEPLPSRPEEYTTAGAHRGQHTEDDSPTGETPKERVENRRGN